jgi:hypothetical protein
MRDLQSLDSNGDLPIGGKTGPRETAAESLLGLDSGNNDDRSLKS